MLRGEVWLINLDPTVGSEIKKKRPAIIVNDDGVGILPLRVIVPITEWKERYAHAKWMVQLSPNAQNGLTKNSAIDTFQIRSVSQKRFINRLGEVSKVEMEEIVNALSAVLALK